MERSTACAPCFFDSCPRSTHHLCSNAVSWSSCNVRCPCKYLHQHISGNQDQWRCRVYHGTGSDSRRGAYELRTKRSLRYGRRESGYDSLCLGFGSMHIHISIGRGDQPLHRYDTRSNRYVHSRRVLQHGGDGYRRFSYTQR